MLKTEKIEKSKAGIISELANKIWPVSYAGVLTAEQISNMMEKIYAPLALVRQMEEGQEFFLIYDDGMLAGFYSLIEEGKTLWLKKLYILPEIQGRGIGRRVVDKLKDEKPEFDSLLLYVNRNNIKAQKFYKKMGFAITSEVPVQMGDYHFVDYILELKLA